MLAKVKSISATITLAICFMLIEEARAQELKHETMACPLGQKTEGSCEVGCRENAMGGG